MTKIELVKRVASVCGITEVAAYKLTEAVIAAMSEALQAGERIELRGFGVFNVVQTKARKARNVVTGAAVDVPAGRKVRFKCSLDMKKPAD